MANFNINLKKEICFDTPSSQELALSKLSGIIKAVGEIQKNTKGEVIMITTETLEVFNAIENLLQALYHASCKLEISNSTGYNDKTKYEITLPQKLTRQILIDTEIAYYDEQNYLCFYDGISKYIIESKEQTVEYIKGVYLGVGTSNIVLSSESEYSKNTGYQLEFVCGDEVLAEDFIEVLAGFGIITKKILRRDFTVIYVQDFEQVCALVGLMGATKSFLSLQNENAFREMRNNVNRQNNCYSGNVTKIVNASVEQLNAIKVLQETVGLESLDLSLQTACYLRLANPEESLDNLVKLSTDGITKSGLYHRFKKIVKLANELKN